jgi:hypothetical protein
MSHEINGSGVLKALIFRRAGIIPFGCSRDVKARSPRFRGRAFDLNKELSFEGFPKNDRADSLRADSLRADSL